VGFIAVAHYWIVVKPIRDKPLNIYFMTLLMMYMFEQIFILLFSPSPKNVQPLISGVIAIGGVRFPTNLLIAIALSLVSLWMLTYVVNNTYPGRAIRAASMDLEASRLMGISPDKIQAFTYLIAGVLGGIGGVFYASYVVASPDMWVYPLIVIFATVIVGGVGSIKGAFIASTIIGYTEIIVTYVWDPKGRGLFALAMMILILLIRPSGLFGR
jgi:branched-chain amino acid transport system permease protein